MPEGTAEQAMRKVADGVLAGDYTTVMASATPDALLQGMQLGGSMMNLPTPESYDMESLGESEGTYSFRLTMKAGEQSVSVTVGWADIEGEWKITGLGDVSSVGFA